MSEVAGNKQIAKNTFFLYARMIILLVVGLYSSRVTLIALGVSDYGIYNVVGGLVTMFVFVNYAMVNSTQRYITYELGKGDIGKLRDVFSTSINIHAGVALIIFFLSETIGLWFLYHKMVIPEERMSAALWIYQFSILNCVISVMNAPYNALIIAHEKMSAFAYISLLDAGLKLLIVIFLQYANTDRLILYGGLLLLITIADRVIYGLYCQRNFIESKYRYVWNKQLTFEMTRFASWNLVGNLSYVCYTQGLNIVLNMFFSPVVNAARGIAVQVQSVIANFSYNIENAIKPQITKNYAQGDKSRMLQLMYASARLSFFALLVLSMPVFFEAETLLGMWLAEVPDHTVNFVRLTILILLADSLTGPLLTAAQAMGDIKKYQLTVSLLCFMILPCAYVSLLIIPVPEIVFSINFIIVLITQIVKLVVVSRQIDISKSEYTRNVFFRSLAVLLLSCVFVIPLRLLIAASVIRLLMVVIISIASVIVSVYTVGLSTYERELTREKTLELFNKIKDSI